MKLKNILLSERIKESQTESFHRYACSQVVNFNLETIDQINQPILTHLLAKKQRHGELILVTAFLLFSLTFLSDFDTTLLVLSLSFSFNRSVKASRSSRSCLRSLSSLSNSSSSSSSSSTFICCCLLRFVLTADSLKIESYPSQVFLVLTQTSDGRFNNSLFSL